MAWSAYWKVALHLSLVLGVLHDCRADAGARSFGSGSAEIATPWFSLRPPVLLDGSSLALKFACPLIFGSYNALSAWVYYGISPDTPFDSLYSEGDRPFFDPWNRSTAYSFEMKLAGNPVNVESLAAQSR